MEGLFSILFIIGIIYLMVWAIKAIIRSATNVPTWTGIIISAIVGMLPLYLILCFFGIMGEKRDQPSNGTQSPIGNYAEEMSRRYAYDSSKRNKKKGWIKYVVLVLVILFLFHLLSSDDSKEPVIATSTETIASDDVIIEEPKEEITPVTIEEKTPVKKQEGKRKMPNASVKKTLDKVRDHLDIESSISSDSIISQSEKNDSMTIEKRTSIVSPPKENNRPDANKIKRKRTGVRPRGTTSDIWEKVNRKSF